MDKVAITRFMLWGGSVTLKAIRGDAPWTWPPPFNVG